MRLPLLSVSFGLAACACASTSASHPGASQRETLARADERAVDEHLSSAVTGRELAGVCNAHGHQEICWTRNTEGNRVEAEQHMEQAMKQRAASQALRDAQARACAGVAGLDREVSPFAHVKDIAEVEPMRRGETLVGVRVTFRHVEGLTPQSLQRIVDCHVAEADALGHEVPEESFCPLNLPNVSATVTAAARGYDVAIVTDDASAAKEALRRAEMLKQ